MHTYTKSVHFRTSIRLCWNVSSWRVIFPHVIINTSKRSALFFALFIPSISFTYSQTSIGQIMSPKCSRHPIVQYQYQCSGYKIWPSNEDVLLLRYFRMEQLFGEGSFQHRHVVLNHQLARLSLMLSLCLLCITILIGCTGSFVVVISGSQCKQAIASILFQVFNILLKRLNNLGHFPRFQEHLLEFIYFFKLN